MKKKVSFADPDFRNKLHDWMQTINPKPQGAELEALKNKYEKQKAAYIESRKGINLEAKIVETEPVDGWRTFEYKEAGADE